jgi:hypothetical protein
MSTSINRRSPHQTLPSRRLTIITNTPKFTGGPVDNIWVYFSGVCQVDQGGDMHHLQGA